MTTDEDFAAATAPDGALAAFVEARDQGLVRYIGFSAHSAEIALQLLDYFPLTRCCSPSTGSITSRPTSVPKLWPRHRSAALPVLALKAMARSLIPQGVPKRYAKCWYDPIDEPELAELALRFALSQPITAALPPGEASLFEMALAMAARLAPLTDTEVEGLRVRAERNTPLFELAAT